MSSALAPHCRSCPTLLLRAAEKGKLEFTATDLDVTVACSVEAKDPTSPAATTMPVKKLFGIVRELNGGEIDLETDEKNVTSVRSGSSYFQDQRIGGR